MTEANLRVYHAFRSPYSRLGLHLLKRAGLSPDVIPFVTPPAGVAFADPMQNKPKLRYYSQDAPRMTLRMGLPIALPNPFDVDFTPANNALALANIEGRGLDFAIAVSDARWGRGENISDSDALKAAASQISWNADKIDAAQDDQRVMDALASYASMIEEDQVFGVPFAVYGESKYWGQDRFDLLLEDIAAG